MEVNRKMKKKNKNSHENAMGTASNVEGKGKRVRREEGR
jgi:hypothetical protein